jgi:hypothetical protein
MIVRRDKLMPAHQPWYIVASDACFADSEVEDVVILEPLHRGDDPMTSYKPTLVSLIRPYFALDAAGKQRFIRTVDDTLSKKSGS